MYKQQKLELERLQDHVSSGRMSRREFLSRLSAMGLGAMAPALYSQSSFAAPKKGGRLRVGIGHGSTTDMLDPATYENGYMLFLNMAQNNHMFETNDKGKLVPELVESYDVDDSAKTWIFNLRKDVEFHNGKSFDSDDVIASFQHHMGETKSPVKGLLEQVTSMRKDGKHQVIFELTAGNADFPYIAGDYHIAMQPSKDGEISANDGIGTGPYMVKDFDPGVRGLMTRNPNYWKEGHGHFDEMELLSIIDPVARTNALTTGEVDLIDRVETKTAHLLARKPGIILDETTGYAHYTFPMLLDVPPFDDNNVRLALKWALPRQEMVEKVLYGHGAIGNDIPISTVNTYHNSELEQHQYDPDKAKFYANKAGGVKVPLHVAEAGFPGSVDAAVLYQEKAAAIGIEIDVIREPNDGYWSNVWIKKPWCACYWGGRPTEDWMFTITHASGGSWNDTHFSNEHFDQLLVTARAETDTNKRREMYYEMQAIVHGQGGTVVPMFNNYLFARSDKVQHGTMAGNWDVDGYKMERWWFA